MFLFEPFIFSLCLGNITPSFIPATIYQTKPPIECQVETSKSNEPEITTEPGLLLHTAIKPDYSEDKTSADTFLMTNGLSTEKGSKYYIKNGEKVKNTWVCYQGGTYYASSTGKLLTGWFVKDGKTYYFDQNCRLKTGWIYLDNIWYYADAEGIVKGWKSILSKDGTEYWYYFDEKTGRMYQDDMTPDGYYVNADGAWIEKLEFPDYTDMFSWENQPEGQEAGPISGLTIAGMPAEFYMLSIAGETSGGANESAIARGDRGRAYGFCQFDYRYDLVGFMKYAYRKHPDLWGGFQPYLSCNNGDPILVGNEEIGNTFLQSMALNLEVSVNDQLSYIRSLYWDGFAAKLNRAGFRLNERHIAVSAALLSVNVNCGPQAVLFVNVLDPDMTDEEMLIAIYRTRNTILADQFVKGVRKGTTKRYLSSEPRMAFDLLYGYTTIDSYVRYGGGVEWHGNPFSNSISTSANEKDGTEMIDLSLVEPDEQIPMEQPSEEGSETEEQSNDLGSWKSDSNGWWVEYADGSYLKNEWYQSPESGLWYYMGEDGYMLTNAKTPDGYIVDMDGAWREESEPN